MTKYVLLFLHFFIFCFIGFDFSSVAIASSADYADCFSRCDSWNQGCIDACYNASAAATTTATASRRSASRQTTKAATNKATTSRSTSSSASSSSQFKCQEPSNIAAQCSGRGWNAVECRCRTQAEVSGNTPSNTGNVGAASSAMSEAVTKCRTAVDEAFNACDQDQDTGMQGAQSALTRFAAQAGAMGMGACSKLAPLLAGANGATVYFSQNCSSSRTECMQTCTKSRNDMQLGLDGLNQAIVEQNRQLVDDYYDQCKKLDSKLAEAEQAIQNIVGTAQGAASCDAATNTEMKSYCETNPTALGCETVATDCSNPTVAASNQICICKNNPNASGCVSALAKVADGNMGSADMSSSSLKPNGSSANIDADAAIGNIPWEGNGMQPSKDLADSVGGKKGAGANLGDGGGGAPGASGEGRGGAAAQATQVNAGFRGGGGGGGGWGGYGGGGYSGEGRYIDPKDPQAKAGGPNLRDFLPNGKMDPRNHRGLAGISGPDGITGPHSDIWKKIQNRYQIQIEGSKLMP